MPSQKSTEHPYAPIIASAMRRPELWRVGLALLGALATGVILVPLYLLITGRLAPNLNAMQLGPRGLMIGATPGGLFIILSSFLCLLLATVVMAQRIHERGLRDLTGPAALMRAQFFVTLKWIAAFTVLSFVLPWDVSLETETNLTFARWLFWLPLALLALMIQVLAEELFFRGYLQSQIAAATGSYPLGLAASAVLFGAAHFDGSATGMAALFPVLWAMGFGALAGDLTMRSGTIGPAVALHLMNNASAILLAAQQDRMSGFALFVQTTPPENLFSDPKIILLQSLLLLISWLVARLALRR